MNSRIKELLSNTLLFAIANLGSKILVFLMVPLYTVVLSTEEYGISDMVQTTTQLLLPIFTMMIADAVLRFSFLKEKDIKLVFTAGVKIILFGAIACLLITILLYIIPVFKSMGLYVFFIPFLFTSNAYVNLLHKFSRGINRVKVSAYAGLFSTIVTISLNLFFLLVLRIGVLGYLLSFIIADIFSILFISAKCDIKSYYTGNYEGNLTKEMIKYSFPLVPNSLSWWMLDCVNRYLILAWLGISSVGIYSATLRIPTILTVLSDIFAQAWLLSALRNYGSEESKNFIRSMYNRYFSLLIVMTSGLIILSEPLAYFLLSGEFSAYWRLIPYLFISVFWGALVGFLGSIFSAERKNLMQFVSTIFGAIVSILITILFLSRYGVVIVAIATLVAYYLIWLVRRIAVKVYINIGCGIIYSSLQGLILLAEAIMVGKKLYLYATLCLLLLILININEIWQIIRFGYKEVYLKFTKGRIIHG